MIEKTVLLGIGEGTKSASAYLISENGVSYGIDGVVTIGRAPHNDIVVEDPYVSATHCQVEKRPLGYYVRDLKSRNGTFLNRSRVTEGELTDGTEICVGNSKLLFQIASDPSLPTCPLSSKNPEWNQQLQNLPHLARSGLPVLLQGESGTGKEVIAHTLHNLSSRAARPFIGVNCSALSEALVESELFGHLKGSYTGASADRKGAFESARGGTLFLDEIGDLPLSLQPKLLRAIENSEIRPVGSDTVIKTDVRLITATHKNLERLVAEKLFRADLYFRIHVVRLVIPALRHRRNDFDDLLYSFAREFQISFSVAAIEALKNHSWPGNIRELKNLVARAKALFPKTRIAADHVSQILLSPQESPYPTHPTMSSSSTLPMLKDVERELIQARLRANGYNQRRTAAELGIPKSTLHDRIRAYNIEILKR